MHEVSIIKCPDYGRAAVDEAVRSAIELLGGIGAFIKPGMRVAVKPNLLLKKKPEDCVTSHPAVIEAICRLCVEAGADTVIAESPGGPFAPGPMRAVYEATGMAAAAEASGASLNEDFGSVDVAMPDNPILKKVSIIRALAEADLIIDVPKLKTHGMMLYTGAVKNMFGAVPGMQKAEYHVRMPDYEDFAGALIDIFLAARPGLCVMDAVIGMDGNGPSHGDPFPFGVVLASADAFAMDKVAVHLTGGDIADIPVLRGAAARGLTAPGLEDVETAGEELEPLVRPDFRKLRSREIVSSRSPMMKLGYRLMDLARPRPVFDRAPCTLCRDCEKNCPPVAIEMSAGGGYPAVDLKKCIRCYCCQELCPTGAVSIGRPLLNRLAFYVVDRVAARRIGDKTRRAG